MSKGYVYILRNESLAPGIFKIGKTTKTPEERAAELSRSTGVPLPFEVVYSVSCNDCGLCESQVHNAFREFRVNGQREFFKVDIDACIETLDSTAEAINNDLILQIKEEINLLTQVLSEVNKSVASLTERFNSLSKESINIEQSYLPTDAKELKIMELYKQGVSITSICRKVYGGTGGKQSIKIKEILSRNRLT